MFDLCEEKNWKATFKKINVLEKKPHKPRQRGGVGSHFMYGGSEFSLPFFLSRKALAETFRSVKKFFLCFHLIFPAILLLLRCNVVWFGVDYGLWINDPL